MLRSFDSIRDCGIFERFTWNRETPDFERINLIYGANGAGKTSLSRALDDLGLGGNGRRRVSLRMSDTDKANSRVSTWQHDPEFDRIYVFSDGYVARSHNFTDDTQIDAVITLGERTVEDEKRITRLRSLITEEAARLAELNASARGAAGALEDGYLSVARGVVNALSRAGGMYRSNGTYSSLTAKRKFGSPHDSWTLLSDAEKTADLAIVNAANIEKAAVKSYSLSVHPGLTAEAQALIEASPVSLILDTLKHNPGAATWVEQGRHLHDGLSQCIFCGSPLTVERTEQIEQHFSEEVERIQQGLDTLTDEVTGIQAALHSLLGDGAIAGSLFEDLRAGFKSAHARAKAQESVLQSWLTSLLEVLQAKRANVIAKMTYTLPAPPSVDGAGVEETLALHNERVTQHGDLVQQAAARLELHLLKESESSIKALAEAAQGAAEERDAAEAALGKYQTELTRLENVEGDPLPSAEVMSRELTRILGRNELGFELLADGKHYRVTRRGAPARDLSTGERTAITLIHFLEHVKRVGSKGGKPIVVIDDPVSSLDSANAMGISTYIWCEAVAKDHIEQVFLLTHNFELFRQWDVQIDGIQGKAAKQQCPARRYELTARHKVINGAAKRVPAFITWPASPDTKVKIRSAYQHAFFTAVRAQRDLAEDDSMEKKLDAQLLYPNMLRRILETFLAFKDPASLGNFTGAMREAGKRLEGTSYEGDPDALRLLLTRFTHSSSHAESPETDAAVNPDEIRTIFAAVFTFMNAIDQPHFDGLCKVVGVQPSDLLA